VLTHDTTAFVEQIDVPKPDRRADKLRRESARAELDIVHVTMELRLAEDALKRMEERRLAEDTADETSHGFRFRRNVGGAGPEARARRMVTELRDRLGAERVRASEIDRQLQDFEETRPHHTSYRLHSPQHHATYSESQFERMAKSQRTRPVLVTTLGGLSWWWYLDRFWWDDERLNASAVRDLVLGRDGESVRHGEETEHTRAVAVGELPPVLTAPDGPVPDAVRTAVWRRDEGRCVDCGVADDLVFDVILPVSRGGSLNTPNIELRCRSCLAIAERGILDEGASTNGARTSRWGSPA
jgi:hypothetical protein